MKVFVGFIVFRFSTGPSTKKKFILNIENGLLLKYFYVVREANDNELH
jgi:hypothetical protein